MKNQLIILNLFLLLILNSCSKKEKEVSDTVSNYCYERIENNPIVHSVSTEELSLINSLFSSNQIDKANLQFYHYEEDNLSYKLVKAYQFVKHLKVFTDELYYHFNADNHFYDLTGDIITEINVNTHSALSHSTVLSHYFNELDNDADLENKEQLKKECFEIELGYYDINAGIADQPKEYVLAWKMRPKNEEYPIAYINDKTSETITYWNGIIH